MFGEYVHIYDIEQAVADGATVPVYYEGRLVKLDLKEGESSHLDEMVEELDEGEEQDTTSARYRKWAALEKVVASQPRLTKVAADLVAHFEERQKVLAGKALVVAMSREASMTHFPRTRPLSESWATLFSKPSRKN